MSYLAHIADKALNCPLLIAPDKAAMIIEVLAGRIGLDSGPQMDRFEGDVPPRRDSEGNVKRNAYGYAEAEPFRVSQGVGIVSVVGTLVNRGAWIGAYSGITSYEGVRHQLKRADVSSEVKAILLDIHSPGGEAVGAFETASLVREVASHKPVTAVINSLAASAGYAIASGASEIIVTESGIAGSIGVVWLHADMSRMLETEGIKPTFVFAGAHKVDGHPFGPLPDAVRADFQKRIDGVYAGFLSCVAAGRGSRLSADAARATEARIYAGAEAVAAGLADRVGTFESALAELQAAATRAPSPGRSSSQKGVSMSEKTGAPAAETNAGTFTQADLDAALARGKAEGQAEGTAKLEADRKRVAGLDALAAKFPGNAKAAEMIAAARIDGSSAEATALKLIEAGVHQQAAALANLQTDDTTAKDAKPAAPGGNAIAPQTPDGWKAEWEKSPDLQAEFPSVEAYVALKKNEARK